MSNLAECLLEEQERVRELVTQYKSLPKGVGVFGATMMDEALKEAERATSSGDVVAMIQAYLCLNLIKL